MTEQTTVTNTQANQSKPAQTPPYPTAAALPTQQAPKNIRFDFNEGCRVHLPLLEETEGTWRIELTDLDTGNILFAQAGLSQALVRSSKRWYVRFGITVWQDHTAEDGKVTSTQVFSHAYDSKDKQVLIIFPVGTLGDTLAWVPYATRFAEVRQARVTCAMSELLIPLFQNAYPHINFVTHDDVRTNKLTEQAYATYYLGLFFDDAACDWQPSDFRLVGLHKTAAYILGVSTKEEPAKISFPDEGRPIEEPYVCIAAQASSQCKYWNNPTGWDEVIKWLKAQGYRVICIDQKTVHGTGIVWNHIPYGAEDQTGSRPLTERARWLKHAAFFIGLGSGLSWLAWSTGTPVVMIAGFSHPTTEFETPFRIINWHTCNSCWNDPKERFDHHDFLWCPRHANTPRQFECTRLITAQQVIAKIKPLVHKR
ncbi:glycosyl transferase [Acetobacter pasteurianus NBRC 101655]|uniref:autotransporter strand-loop-strand O-heptosyltransferase n=1 Tax=Acetobacter pasteurianus TaxID=438 RepID=UPI00024576BF|nr:autotransporter strand-loop-strand O-heptosyltransferase [Acetobacter pasteurianus]BAU37222.1 glycosyl transferase [Acetobacter pasteurianus NBRC 101655]CCT59709.1 glycosyl transferase [Acetobacter pasteurianus 386B]